MQHFYLFCLHTWANVAVNGCCTRAHQGASTIHKEPLWPWSRNRTPTFHKQNMDNSASHEAATGEWMSQSPLMVANCSSGHSWLWSDAKVDQNKNQKTMTKWGFYSQHVPLIGLEPHSVRAPSLIGLVSSCVSWPGSVNVCPAGWWLIGGCLRVQHYFNLVQPAWWNDKNNSSVEVQDREHNQMKAIKS